MTPQEQSEAARQFYYDWKDKGKEDEHDHSFWIDIFQKILGVEDATSKIEFQKKVLVEGHTKRIDAYVTDTNVLIEQKSRGIPLDKKIHNSGDIALTPYEQAKRYNDNLPHSEKARYIVTSNFAEIWVYDMEKRDPEAEVQKIYIENLQTEVYRLEFLVKHESAKITKELTVSKQAGELVGVLYDELYKSYNNPTDETLKSLNKLCVRLVFCMYAEDAGLFGKKDMFYDYLKDVRPKDMRRALKELFRILDTPEEERDPDEDEELLSFPYVNGGLFADEDISIPQFTDELKFILLEKASNDFDWSDISPTIFGAIFESTLNPETRRKGGMHYTSIENIHKVIDPLFLDELKTEFEEIKNKKNVGGVKNRALKQFQDKLASLKFLDPAAGSGNFLTESYTSLRKLENQVLRELMKDSIEGQMTLNLSGVAEELIDIKVSIQQFYGIEINDFAVTVAKTALWIAESQMMKETLSFANVGANFLPLKSYVNIIEGNSLNVDWNSILPKEECNYIMGNPPFIGLSLRSEEQKNDMSNVFFNNKRAGRLDYVAAWYKKAESYITNTKIEIAYVSTNSISQGEQAPILWEELFKNGVIINFAYSTFKWESEATDKAGVSCVIIGFSKNAREKKYIYENDTKSLAYNINGYLVNADNIFIELRGKSISNRPKLIQGSKPWDGGNLILSEEERNILINKYPIIKPYIKQYMGSNEFINGKIRYCLWLLNASPDIYRNIPEIMQRLKNIVEIRKATKTVAVQKQANTPMLFSQIRQPNSDYLFVPETSSENRYYIPIGFLSKEVIASNSSLVGEGASLFDFGIITSNVHMAWMRTVAGRLESRYRYSPSVYNNFPLPSPTPEQKKRIEETAQGILDARALYPNSSLADLYDPLTMPRELQKAHTANDIAVMNAYGMSIKDTSASDCVAYLMKMYQEIVNNK